ncbi:DUF4183 domain-containing protein [Paenibacillus senegalimassiliensis]|uniref:DUF4183 domain-containing protein n=1 Tax=Paenibacillus senegalimassiliensis TaxID=1737426 RepID=UPI00073F74CE|nr:DUF4183 domain-containing protein [Paenibacillus senegalimassiliensis]
MPVIRLYLTAESTITGSVNTTTTTSVVPEVHRYTAAIVLGDILAGTTTLAATRFTNNGGNTVPAGGLVVPTANGYYNLYVNGVMQRGGLSTLTATSLVINSALVIGATVVVKVVNFNSTSNSLSNTSNLSVTTTVTY